MCFSSRMKPTAFLLVFGVALSFCLAQVSANAMQISQISLSRQHMCISRLKLWWSLHILSLWSNGQYVCRPLFDLCTTLTVAVAGPRGGGGSGGGTCGAFHHRSDQDGCCHLGLRLQPVSRTGQSRGWHQHLPGTNKRVRCADAALAG